MKKNLNRIKNEGYLGKNIKKGKEKHKKTKSIYNGRII